MLDLLFGLPFLNRYNYHHRGYERDVVGGGWLHLLSNKQFDMFLTLLLIAMVVNMIGRTFRDPVQDLLAGTYSTDKRHAAINLYFAPMTCLTVMLLIYLYFEETLRRGKSMLKNWNKQYSFHPARIYYEKQYYRLITGQLLHANKFHLYMNCSSLIYLGHEEFVRTTRNGLGLLGFGCYLALLVVAVGVTHIYLVKWLRFQEDMHVYSVGFSGVIFALKTLNNYDQIAYTSHISIPLLADMFTFYIPLAVPTCTQHFFELFIISIIFPRADYWGHVAGIVAGYGFALLWNLKRIWKFVWTGEMPRSTAASTYFYPDGDVEEMPYGLLDRKYPKSSRAQPAPLIPPKSSYQHYLECQDDFKTAYGIEGDSTVTELCRMHGNILEEYSRANKVTPGNRFTNCMQQMWVYDYYNHKAYGYTYDSNNRNAIRYDERRYQLRSLVTYDPRTGNMAPTTNNPKHLDPSAIVDATQTIVKQAAKCSRAALLSNCQFREFGFQDIFRAHYSLHDRLALLADTDAKCQAEINTTLLQVLSANNTLTSNVTASQSEYFVDDDVEEDSEDDDYYEEDEVEDGNKKNKADKPLSLQEKMKSKRNDIQQGEKVYGKCLSQLEGLSAADMKQRIGDDSPTLMQAHCKRQATFMKCAGIHEYDALESALADPAQQTVVTECLLEAMTGHRGKGRVGGGDPQTKQEGLVAYLKDNGLALIVTVVVLLVFQRFLGPGLRAPATSEDPTADQKGFDSLYGDGDESQGKEDGSVADISKEGKGEDFNSEEKDIPADDGSDVLSVKEEVVQSENEPTGDMLTPTPADEDEEEELENFDRALDDLMNENEDDFAAIAKALEVMETIITNATNLGQDPNNKNAAKYLKVRINNPTIQKYSNLKGVLDLMMSVGFSLRRGDADGEQYMVFPSGGTGPSWLPYAIAQLQQKRQEMMTAAGAEYPKTGNDGDYNDKDAQKKAAAAALARFEAKQSQLSESKAKQKSRKFTAGMGGGESRTVYYPGGT